MADRGRVRPAGPSRTPLLGGAPDQEGQWVIVLAPMLHRDPVWGDNAEAFDPSRFAPRAGEGPPGARLQAVRHRRAGLHRPAVRAARGDAAAGDARHRYRLLDSANYQLRIKETLTLKPDGFRLAGPAHRRDRPWAEARPGFGRRRRPPRPPGRPAKSARAPTLTVLHGTNLGTCRDIAAQLADEGADRRFTTVAAPLDDLAGKLPTDRPVVIVAASYNGQPTDDAARFVPWLEDAALGRADAVSFRGAGCRRPQLGRDLPARPDPVRRPARRAGGRAAGGPAPKPTPPATSSVRHRVRGATCCGRHSSTRYGDPDTAPAPRTPPDRPYTSARSPAAR